MTELCRCSCCKGPLEPAQQLRFLVETDTLDDPAYLARIRVLPAVNGKPVPVCKACQTRIETAPRPSASRTGVLRPPLARKLLGALGALSVGLLLTGLFAPRG